MNQELVFERELGLRDKGPGVKRVQEWLNLHGYGLSIDRGYPSGTPGGPFSSTTLPSGSVM